MEDTLLPCCHCTSDFLTTRSTFLLLLDRERREVGAHNVYIWRQHDGMQVRPRTSVTKHADIFIISQIYKIRVLWLLCELWQDPAFTVSLHNVQSQNGSLSHGDGDMCRDTALKIESKECAYLSYPVSHFIQSSQLLFSLS